MSPPRAGPAVVTVTDVTTLARTLHETTAADASRIAAAEASLNAASDAPGYGAALLQCIAHASSPDPSVATVALPAATTLHNYARSRWPRKLVPGEREPLRAAILHALCVAPPGGPVVKLLAETFSIVVTEDVSRAKCWPDLLPALCAAVSGAFYTLVPIRPRSRGGRRSLRTFAVLSLRPPLAFNPRPRRL